MYCPSETVRSMNKISERLPRHKALLLNMGSASIKRLFNKLGHRNGRIIMSVLDQCSRYSHNQLPHLNNES